MNDVPSRLLAIVQRKLDLELQCARASLAELRKQARAQDEGLHALQASSVRHASHAGVRPGEAVDPARYAQGLNHLVHLRADVARGERAAKAMHREVEDAVARCLLQDGKCGATRKLRERLERQQTVDAQRRAASEADRAWLARCGRSGAPGVAE